MFLLKKAKPVSWPLFLSAWVWDRMTLPLLGSCAISSTTGTRHVYIAVLVVGRAAAAVAAAVLVGVVVLVVVAVARKHEQRQQKSVGCEYLVYRPRAGTTICVALVVRPKPKPSQSLARRAVCKRDLNLTKQDVCTSVCVCTGSESQRCVNAGNRLVSLLTLLTSQSRSHRTVGTADSVSHNTACTACVFKGSTGDEKLHCSAFGTNLELLDREAKGRHMVQTLLVLCARHTESSFVSRMQWTMQQASIQHLANPRAQQSSDPQRRISNLHAPPRLPTAATRRLRLAVQGIRGQGGWGSSRFGLSGGLCLQMLPEVEKPRCQVDNEEEGLKHKSNPNHDVYGRLCHCQALVHPGKSLCGQGDSRLDDAWPHSGRVHTWRLDDVAQGAVRKPQRRIAGHLVHHLA